MPSRTKRKGNPDVDGDGYPGPIGPVQKKDQSVDLSKSYAERNEEGYRRDRDEYESEQDAVDAIQDPEFKKLSLKPSKASEKKFLALAKKYTKYGSLANVKAALSTYAPGWLQNKYGRKTDDDE